MDFVSIGCPTCSGKNCQPLNQYQDEYEIGWHVECLDCEAMWDEPTVLKCILDTSDM